MIKILIVCEDTLIDAKLIHEEFGPKWEGECIDLPTGQSESFKWTQNEMTAVLALGLGAVGEEGVPGYDSEILNQEVQYLFKNWKKVCIPIP